MSQPESGRVLSIQSHVVSGYVGNRAATFPLQMLGYDVDVVNTVQFSNHTGYGFTDGHKTTPAQLHAIFNGLTVNGLIGHSRALTGYIPGAEALQAVAKQIDAMKERNPDLIYVLDPVMGDIGTGLYVSEDVVPIYRDMLRLATIITPNQFEVELLSGIKISTLQSLHSALYSLHTDNRLAHVAFSSIPLPSSMVKSLCLPPPPHTYTHLLPDEPLPWYNSAEDSSLEDDVLVCFASSKLGEEMETWAFALPTVQGYFSGVGDLFSAMVLAHFHPQTTHALPPLVYAVSKALLIVQQVLLQTHLYSLAHPSALTSGMATPRPLHKSPTDSVIPTDNELDALQPTNGKDPKRRAKRMRLRELRVVQERHLLTQPGAWEGKQLNWLELLK